VPCFQTHPSLSARCLCPFQSQIVMQLLTLCCTAATCRRVQAVDRACVGHLLHRRCVSVQQADRHQQPLPGVHRTVHRLRQAGGTLLACHHAFLLRLEPGNRQRRGRPAMQTPAPCCQSCIMLSPAGLDAELHLTATAPNTVASTRHLGTAASCAVQVETTVSNSILRITGSWIGSSIGFGIMSSAIATNPYGAPVSLPRYVHCRP